MPTYREDFLELVGLDQTVPAPGWHLAILQLEYPDGKPRFTQNYGQCTLEQTHIVYARDSRPAVEAATAALREDLARLRENHDKWHQISIRRLEQRDAERADIDGLRRALDLRMGDGLSLAEITSHVLALGVTGDHIKAVAMQVEQAEARIHAEERTATLAMDQPWCVPQIIEQLCKTADRLLNTSNSDHLGWERDHHARAAGRAWLTALGWEGSEDMGTATPRTATPRTGLPFGIPYDPALEAAARADLVPPRSTRKMAAPRTAMPVCDHDECPRSTCVKDSGRKIATAARVEERRPLPPDILVDAQQPVSPPSGRLLAATPIQRKTVPPRTEVALWTEHHARVGGVPLVHYEVREGIWLDSRTLHVVLIGGEDEDGVTLRASTEIVAKRFAVAVAREMAGAAPPLPTEPVLPSTDMWAQDGETRQWWLCRMRDGEPITAYHPEHGTKPAHRDTFVRWHTGETAIPRETSLPTPADGTKNSW